MAVTGWKTPGTTVNDTSIGSKAWTTPNNAQTDNGTAAVCDSDNNVDLGNYLKATNFGFTSSDVPSGATIDGIEMQVKRRTETNTGNTLDYSVKIVKGGTISGNEKATTTNWLKSSSSWETITYGSSTELWGLSWSQSDVTASTFGIAYATKADGSINKQSEIDVLQLRVYYTAAGTTVSPNDASHSHAADNATITQNHVVGINNGAHAHSADNTTLSQIHSLTVQDTTHGHTADTATLGIVVTLQDATHAHTADNATVTQVHSLTLQDASHAHAADNLSLSQIHTISVQDAAHSHSADNTSVAEEVQVSPADASHDHTADNTTLSQTHTLLLEDTAHAHTADNTGISQIHVLSAQDTSHTHSTDSATISQTHLLTLHNADHGHTAENITISQNHWLLIHGGLHTHGADTVTVDVFISVANNGRRQIALSREGRKIVPGQSHPGLSPGTQGRLITPASGRHLQAGGQGRDVG